MGNFEYQMDKKMFDTIVKARKGEDKKKNPFKYVVDYINQSFGIKGNCSKVILK